MTHLPSRRAATALLAVLLPGLVLAGCGDDSEGSSPTTTASSGPATTVDIPADKVVDLTAQSTVEITVRDNTFEPSYFEVKPGTKILFRNDGRNQHNVTPVEDGRFDPIETAEFAPGKVGAITVDGSGDIPFYCTIHGTKKLNGQSGVIRIAT